MPTQSSPTSATILVVEDDPTLSELLRYNLEKVGYQVRAARRGDQALDLLREEKFDLAIFDWMLPGVSGLTLCREVRRMDRLLSLPIIMLTARGEEEDRVAGLTQGADDYVVKPFSVAELLARVAGLLRRADPVAARKFLVRGDIEVDLEHHRLQRAGREITLGPREHKLLTFLMLRPGRVFSRSELLDQVWGEDQMVSDRTVDVTVRRLRQALTQAGEVDPMRTVRGTGYAFDEKYGD